MKNVKLNTMQILPKRKNALDAIHLKPILLEKSKVTQMNNCCVKPGNAAIMKSTRLGVAWRVVCIYCGLILHEQKEGEE